MNGSGRTILRLAIPTAVLACAAGASADIPPEVAEKLQTYKTPYYVLHTDLPIEKVREAAVRITAMAEEYHRRTCRFAGTVRRRLPFYLFSEAEDYHAAGGLRGSAGRYMGGRGLMAVAREGRTWEVVQHEGFHQFAHRAIGGRLPIWVNEGLAEYFGHGIWTGDGFVTGVIPPRRLRRVRRRIRRGEMLPLDDLLTMTSETWSAELSGRNYDQAWSVVHFLVHAEDGKYRPALGAFLRDLSRGRGYRQAFAARFGRDVDAFEETWKQWWLRLGDHPTEGRYIGALVETLTSYLARAQILRLKLATAEDFFAAAREGKIAIDARRRPRYWLPESLLRDALAEARKHEGWSLDTSGGLPKLVLSRPDGTEYVGKFLPLRGNPRIRVEKHTPPASASSQPADPAEASSAPH